MLSVDSQESEDNLRQVNDTLPTLVWCSEWTLDWASLA